MSDIEEYRLAETEVLSLQLLQSELDRAATQLQLSKERAQAYQRELAGKYSEHGRYELVGELDLAKRTGQRRLVTSPAVEADASES